MGFSLLLSAGIDLGQQNLGETNMESEYSFGAFLDTHNVYERAKL